MTHIHKVSNFFMPDLIATRIHASAESPYVSNSFITQSARFQGRTKFGSPIFGSPIVITSHIPTILSDLRIRQQIVKEEELRGNPLHISHVPQKVIDDLVEKDELPGMAGNRLVWVDDYDSWKSLPSTWMPTHLAKHDHRLVVNTGSESMAEQYALAHQRFYGSHIPLLNDVTGVPNGETVGSLLVAHGLPYGTLCSHDLRELDRHE